ncbi:flavin reductase [uncultured Arthrobacter sp.]|uniref:flavin reductase n=1 Tax=uncultured Arthrobacter sp. TaxID=114050 RepID=UPI0025F01510|nr:flavin reductase [uncultured Arthrobacter sp.]
MHDSGPGAIDPRRYRDVLGQYPTGVTVVTSIDETGHPIGLAVGSFTSVSLDPPLVAFCPAKTSTTWPRIAKAGRFCVNVLAARQEPVCRQFSSRMPNKFEALSWAPAGTGSPILDGAVAWIDCELETVHRAGDHDIVVGAVRDLGTVDNGLPLLFFGGGYGQFQPLTFTTASDDVLEQLRLVDEVRPAMESIARDLSVECDALALHGSDMVFLARAGSSSATPTAVGRRVPFQPPMGLSFAAWGGDRVRKAWFDSAPEFPPSPLEDMLARVRRRGYAVGLGNEFHTSFWRALTSSAPEKTNPIVESADLPGAEYDQRDLDPDQTYEVRTLSAPVFDSAGRVLLLTLYGLPDSTGEQVAQYAETLCDLTRNETRKLGGRLP